MKKGRHSICCVSPVASKAHIARFIFLLAFFSQDSIRIFCPKSKGIGHLLYLFFMEVVLGIGLVGMGAGGLSICPKRMPIVGEKRHLFPSRRTGGNPTR